MSAKLKSRKMWAHPDRLIMLPKEPTGLHAKTGPFVQYLVVPLCEMDGIRRAVALALAKEHGYGPAYWNKFEADAIAALCAIGIRAPKKAASRPKPSPIVKALIEMDLARTPKKGRK